MQPETTITKWDDWGEFGETYKATRWEISYTNKLGKAMNMRFTYGQMAFETKEAAERELALILKSHNDRSSNEDYRVDRIVVNVLRKPIYPFNDNE